MEVLSGWLDSFPGSNRMTGNSWQSSFPRLHELS